MQEAQFLGSLLLSHPDFEPIIEAMRKKYQLQEVYPQDDPIKEIYLDDKIVSLAEFSKDIRNQVIENLGTIFPEDYVKKYNATRLAIEINYQAELEKFPDNLKPTMELFFEFTKNSAQTVYQILDTQIDGIVNMICNNLLLGDMPEAPQDWFGKVFTSNSGGEKIIFAMASEITNLDFMFQQIRDAHKKAFGKKHVKITDKIVSTSYYLQLARRKKDRDFILDEFIRLNGFKLTENKNSPRYAEVRNKYWQRLRKRLKKADDIVNAIIGQGKK